MTAIAEANLKYQARVKDALDKISVSGKHLLGLVNDDTPDPGDHSVLSEIKKNDFSGKRILIAEDNPLNMEIACEILKMAGPDIIEAENRF